MDAVIKPWPKSSAADDMTLSDHVRAAPAPVVPKPSREQALAAVRTLIAYAGDNPDREGLRDTPKRVIDAYEELYSGYRECPVDVVERTFSEIGRYDDFVLVRDIAFNSHCEHHMMPFTGKAHIAYKPIDRVVGLSKLARLVDVYARRLQTQEHMTSQIATAIEEILKPRGIAVMIEAEHMCMSLRGWKSRAPPRLPPSLPAASATAPTIRSALLRWCAALIAERRGWRLGRFAQGYAGRAGGRTSKARYNPALASCEGERAPALRAATTGISGEGCLVRPTFTFPRARPDRCHRGRPRLRSEIRCRWSRRLRRHRYALGRRADGRPHER